MISASTHIAVKFGDSIFTVLKKEKNIIQMLQVIQVVYNPLVALEAAASNSNWASSFTHSLFAHIGPRPVLT